MDGRLDFDKYNSGCRLLENWRVRPSGPIENMPGTEFIAEVKDSSKETIVLPFQFSTTTHFAIEVGNQYMRFHSNGQRVVVPDATAWATTTGYVIGDTVKESGNTYYCLEDHTSGTFATDLAADKWVLLGVVGDPYEITAPYLEADLYTLQTAQNADVMYIVGEKSSSGSGYEVRELKRIADSYWTLSTATFDFPPLLDPNATSTTITPSGTTGSITLTASADIFEDGMEGGTWEIRHPRTDNEADVLINGSLLTSSSVPVNGDWVFTTTGTWTGIVEIDRSTNGGSTWTTIRTFTSNSDRNFDASGTEDLDGALYRMRVASHSAGSGNANLFNSDFFDIGLVEITNVTNKTTASGTVVKTLGGTGATEDWTEGAFSDYRGHPEAVTLHQQRLIFGGTLANPQTVWGSKVDKNLDFELGTNDADAIKFTISARQRNNIRWIESHGFLVIGTSGAEYTVGSTSDSGGNITPSNISVRRQSGYGTSSVRAVLLNEILTFMQRDNKKMREFTFSLEKDGFTGNDLTLLAEDITGDGFLQLGFQQSPYSIFWAAREDGQLCSMTFEKSQNVFAWSRHTTDGEYRSVAVLDDTPEDSIYTVVKRTIDGSTKRYVERFKAREFNNIEDNFFVHSGLESVAVTDFTITDATQADPVVVTAAGHGLSNGDNVRIVMNQGMVELHGNVYTVANSTASTFELKNENGTEDVDGTGFTAFSGTGTGFKVSNTFSGLDHLEGKTVSVLADGAVQAQVVVSSGSVTLQNYFKKAIIGLPYESKVLPMPFDAITQGGSTTGKVKRISKIMLQLYSTLGLKYSNNDIDYDEVLFRNLDDPMDQQVPLFTGIKQVSFQTGHNREGDIYLKQDQPLPCTIVSFTPLIVTHGPNS
jgi:hypothetical protein